LILSMIGPFVVWRWWGKRRKYALERESHGFSGGSTRL
jgi:hypothetical protein